MLTCHLVPKYKQWSQSLFGESRPAIVIRARKSCAFLPAQCLKPQLPRGTYHIMMKSSAPTHKDARSVIIIFVFYGTIALAKLKRLEISPPPSLSGLSMRQVQINRDLNETDGFHLKTHIFRWFSSKRHLAFWDKPPGNLPVKYKHPDKITN